jgi:hypothetical protein
MGRVETVKETVVDVGRYVVSVCCGGAVKRASIVRGSGRERIVDTHAIVKVGWYLRIV